MKEIHTLDALQRHIRRHGTLDGTAVQQVDLTDFPERELRTLSTAGALFLGCAMSASLRARLQIGGALVMQAPPGLPFEPFRARLYTRTELFDTFDPADPQSYCDCLDARVYAHWQRTGGAEAPYVADTVFRALHDQSIGDALHDLLERTDRPVVAVMGGHSMQRGAARYRDVARIARELTRRGYLLVSGGGPGAMEATHLGALTATQPERVLDEAIEHLAVAPSYRHERWLATAFDVLDTLGPPESKGPVSIGIPTWHYGHEPPTPFASHIAKYFANSLREAGLLTIARAGILFAPGSAGTIQEVFQDAAQNHYATTGQASPMIFLGETYWRREKPVYPLLERLAREKPYHDLLRLVDTAEEAVEVIDALAPVHVEDDGWSFCDAHGSDPGEAA